MYFSWSQRRLRFRGRDKGRCQHATDYTEAVPELSKPHPGQVTPSHPFAGERFSFRGTVKTRLSAWVVFESASIAHALQLAQSLSLLAFNSSCPLRLLPTSYECHPTPG